MTVTVIDPDFNLCFRIRLEIMSLQTVQHFHVIHCASRSETWKADFFDVMDGLAVT